MSKIIRNILLISSISALLIAFSLLSERELPYLEIQSENRSEYIPDTVETEIRMQSLSALSAHFPDQVEPLTISVEPEPEIEIEVDTGPRLTSDIKFISTIVKSEVKHFYFKIVRSGKLIILTTREGDSGWNILTIEDDYFLLQNGEITYKVLKK